MNVIIFSDENQARFDSKVTFFEDKENPVCSRDVKHSCPCGAFCFLCWTTTVVLIWSNNTESDGEGKHLNSCTEYCDKAVMLVSGRISSLISALYHFSSLPHVLPRQKEENWIICIKGRSRKFRQVSRSEVMRGPIKWCHPDCVARLRCSSLSSSTTAWWTLVYWWIANHLKGRGPPTHCVRQWRCCAYLNRSRLAPYGCGLLSQHHLLTSLSDFCCIFIILINIMHP